MRKSFLPFLVLALAVGWLAGTLVPIPGVGPASPLGPSSLAAPPVGSRVLPPTSLPFASMPDVRQSTGYTCGASALQAVLAYWGI
ncbi:MAG: hypothetical protein JW775_05990, partial [Candidatus Aminicenantes bacterium]|nr:hypothetical protein [Candidatus Aminicenantes bacterium]